MPESASSPSDEAQAKLAIGRRLRDLRVSREWTQSDLAKLAGKSVSSISAYERGTRALSMHELATICAAFDMLLVEFLDGLPPYGA